MTKMKPEDPLWPEKASPYDLKLTLRTNVRKRKANKYSYRWRSEPTVHISHRCTYKLPNYFNEKGIPAEIKQLPPERMMKKDWRGATCWRCGVKISRYHIQKVWMMQLMSEWSK